MGTLRNVTRTETPVETAQGQHCVLLLDADDSFDVVVQYPNGEREIVWSLVKEVL